MDIEKEIAALKARLERCEHALERIVASGLHEQIAELRERLRKALAAAADAGGAP